MKIKTVLLSIAFLSVSLTRGYPAVTELEFLKIVPSARPAALGESFVALSDDINAVYFNPAGLGFIIQPELQASHMLGLGDTYNSFAGYLHPSRVGAFAVTCRLMGMPAMTRIENSLAGGTFSPSSLDLGVTYGFKLHRKFSAGLTLRYISDRLDSDYSAQVFGCDIGALYRNSSEVFSAGISAQNLGSKFTYSGSALEAELPMLIRAGLALKLDLPEHNANINISLEGGQYRNGYSYAALGIEHIGAKTLALRLGYRYILDETYRSQLDNLSQFRAGLGFRIKTVNIDYAYQPFALLGDAHRVSFSKKFIGWGGESGPGTETLALKVDPDVFSPNNDGVKDIAFFFPKFPDKDKIRSWKLTVYDKIGIAVHSADGQGLPDIISWDGKEYITGEPAPEDKYFVEFTMDCNGKLIKSSEEKLKIDLTPPSVNLRVSTPTISPNNDGSDDTVSFNFTAEDPNLLERWELDILNRKNNVIKKFKSDLPVNKNSLLKSVAWDGKDELYEKAVPNDTYAVRLTVWDIPGNNRTAGSELSVDIPREVKIIEKVIEKVREVKVKEEARGLVVSLSSEVLFDVGRAALKPESAKALSEVIKLLNAYPENNVIIEGHTDSTGSRETNIDLSSKRAWGVYSYLVKNGGVTESRLSAKGFGPDKPVASNSNEKGRAKNRRVEIIILKK